MRESNQMKQTRNTCISSLLIETTTFYFENGVLLKRTQLPKQMDEKRHNIKTCLLTSNQGMSRRAPREACMPDETEKLITYEKQRQS